MSRAVGTNAQLAYIDEVTWGVTPASPTLQAVRFVEITPTQQIDTVQSQEASSAREIQDYIQTAAKGGVTFSHEYSYGNLHGQMESLFGNTWSTNVLTVSNTRKSHAVELQFTDIGQYCLLEGAIVNALSVEVKQGAIVGGSVGYTSKFPSWSTSSVSGSAPTAAPTNAIEDPINSLQLLQDGGSGSVEALEFTMALSNGLIEFPVLGDLEIADLQLGQFKAEGTLSTYFADRALVDKTISFVDTSIAVTLGGASSKKDAFLFSKVKLQLESLSGIKTNSGCVAKFKWMAKADATNSTAKVTRTP